MKVVRPAASRDDRLEPTTATGAYATNPGARSTVGSGPLTLGRPGGAYASASAARIPRTAPKAPGSSSEAISTSTLTAPPLMRTTTRVFSGPLTQVRVVSPGPSVRPYQRRPLNHR